MRHLFILVALMGLSACGYSPAVVENAYDNLGRQYATELKQLGDFDEEQKAGIDDFVQGLHRWHRTNRLPDYAELVSRLGAKLAQGDTVTDDDLAALLRMMSHYPHFHEATASNRELAKIATTLNDEQFGQLSQTIHEQLNDYREQLLATSTEAVQRDQVRYVNSILEFLGVTLSKQQLDLIRSHSTAFHDQRNDRLSVMFRWHEELIELLAARRQADFQQRFVAHMAKDNEHVQLVDYAPETTKENDRLAVLMLQDLLASFNDEQRETLTSSLQSLARTLTAMTEHS